MPATEGPLDLSNWIGVSSDRAYKNWGTAQEQLDAAKKAYAKAEGISDTVTKGALDSTKAFTDASTGDRAFWEGTYKPAMQEQMDFARGYTTPERMMANRAAAGATVGRTADAGMQSAMRNLQSYGIDPSSGSYAGLQQGLALQKAAAQAGAMTKSDRDTEMLGQQYLGNAINTGAALPGQAVNEAGLAMTQGNTALNATLAPANSYFNWSGTAPQWNAQGDAMQGQIKDAYVQQTQAGQRENELKAKIEADKAKQSSGAGAAIGAGLGLAGTLAGAYFGGPMGASIGGSLGRAAGSGMTFAKGGPVRGFDTMTHFIPGFADGGMIRPHMAEGGPVPGEDEFDWEDGESDMSAMGPEMGQPTPEVSGNFVPAEASPTGGAQTDDVTAQVNVGEFIIPKDVTAWLGEKFFQKLIEKSRTELQGPQVAEPEEGPPQAMAMSPTFRSEGAMAGV